MAVEPEVTPTNEPRLAREARANLRGDLPTAAPGSVAEQFGYSAPLSPNVAGEGAARLDTRRAARIRQDAIARREWLQWRRLGIGASDIAAIMGWGFSGSSPYKVWAEKVGLIASDDVPELSELFEYGHRMEGPLADWFEEATGLYVGSVQERRVHPDLDWALATIDGEVFEGPAEQSEPIAGFEAKTAGSFGWRADEPIPDAYICQAQWAMFVCGWERVWFAVLHEHRFRTYTLDRDDDDIAVLRAHAERFWFDHVVPAVPPPVDSLPATRVALTRAYPGDREKSTAFLTDHDDSLAMLREAKANVDVWKRTATLYENVIKEQMGDATYADFGNGPEVTWSRFTRRNVDTKLLKSRYPDVWDEVAKTAETSRFTIAGAREEEDF